jgi:ABC-type transporter Mla subunit MlaD
VAGPTVARRWPTPEWRTDTDSLRGADVAKKPPISRVPSAVGAIPVVGDLVRSADQQARWMQEMLEQNARLIGQFPATMKSFNDALERFNQTVGRLDAAVTRIESASRTLTGPLEKAAGALDPQALREIPETLEALRRETVPALRAAVDTQRQVAVLQGTIERIVTVVSDLPGAGLLRRRSTGRDADAGRPRPEPAAGEVRPDS